MIAYLKGEFVYKSPALLHVEVNGVGYEVHISLNTFSALQGLQQGIVYTHLHIREDAHLLYGFASVTEKEMFLLLTGVNSIGAATARMMLSGMRPEELALVIAGGDARQLEKIKGIGRKTADRIILELKDKVGKYTTSGSIALPAAGAPARDAVDALVALGIGRPAAEQAVKKTMQANPDMQQLEDIIKKALQLL